MPYLVWIILILVLALGLGTLVHRSVGQPVSTGRRWLTLCLVVHDQVDNLEGLVRELAVLSTDLGPALAETLIVDASSSDGTWELLGRLGRAYPALSVFRWQPQDASGGPLDLAATMASTPWLLVCRTSGSQTLGAIRGLHETLARHLGEMPQG